MKILSFILSLIFLVLFSGCATTNPNKFDYYDTELVVVQGDAYYVPKNTYYGKFPDKSWVREYQSYGLKNCRMGDLLWRAKGTDKSLDVIENSDLSEEQKKAMRFAGMQTIAKYGMMGCKKPLSKEQIQRHLDYMQTQSMINAMNRPVRHEVSVFHY